MDDQTAPAGPLGERIAAPTAAHLTGVLRRVEEIAGRRAALRLAELHGGTRLYVPKQPRPDCPLAEAVGLEAAERIAGEWGGEYLELAQNKRALAFALKEEGLPDQAIARRLKISPRTLSRWWRGGAEAWPWADGRAA